MLEEPADPTPAPSPGPAPTPPKPEPKGWQVPLDPPPQASKALADYVVDARDIFQDLADTLGTPEYAVSPPVAPPLLPADKAAGLAGFATESYSTSQNVLQGHQTVWHGADGAAVTIAQRAATVGSTALQQLQDLVYRLQEMLIAANLDRTVPASYTERPSAGGGLASYAEYRLAVTIERTLMQAYDVVASAQAELGFLDTAPWLVPQFPTVPKGIVPPQPVPMPERQRHPQSPGTLEV